MLIETAIKQIHVNLKSSATTVAITTTKSQILQIQTPQNYSLAYEHFLIPLSSTYRIISKSLVKMGIPNLSKADEEAPHTFYHILNMSTIFRRVKIKQQQQQKTNTFFHYIVLVY